MKLVCYIKEGHEQLAMLVNNTLYDMDTVHPELPSTMSMFLNYWEDYFPLAKAINESIIEGKISLNKGIPLESASLISPVPLPSSCIGASAFVSEESRNDSDLPGDVQQIPDFHFTNHHIVQGPGEVSCMPDYLEKLDFELGVAIVVCAHGRNIIAGEANQYIGGYMIGNSIVSRAFQRDITQPGKGVATVLGPWLITPDELDSFKVPAKEGHTGDVYGLTIKCSINGEQVCEGSLADMNRTFAEILESCAYGAYVQPGDIIFSGPAPTGSYLNLNETGKRNDPNYSEQWLKAGDIVEMEIESLGISSSTIIAEDSELSLKRQ